MLSKKEYNNFVKENDLSKAYFLYFLILVGLIVFRILSSLGVLSIFGEGGDYIFTFIIQVLILFGLSFFAFGKMTKKSKNLLLKEYKFKKISKKASIITIFMGIIVYFLNSFIASFFYFILSFFGYSISSSGAIVSYPIWLLVLNLIFTAVLPAVCEETAHRGMLLSQISKKNVLLAIIISSFLFGLLHINIYQFFYATILGFFLAKLTLMSGSIYPAMIIHFINNALNVYMSFASVNNLLSAKLVNSLFAFMNVNNIFGVLFFFLFISFLVLGLKFLYDELKAETTRGKIAKIREGLGKIVAREMFFEGLKEIENGQMLSQDNGVDISIIKQYLAKNIEKNEKKEAKRVNFYEKLFLFTSISLSLVATIFTFVWGII